MTAASGQAPARPTSSWANQWHANFHYERINLQACAEITPGIINCAETRLRSARVALASVPRSAASVLSGDPERELKRRMKRAMGLETWRGMFHSPAPSLAVGLIPYEEGDLGRAGRIDGKPWLHVFYDNDDARNLYVLLHELAHLAHRPWVNGKDPECHGAQWRALMHYSVCEWILDDPHPFTLTDADAGIVASEIDAYERAVIAARARVQPAQLHQ